MRQLRSVRTGPVSLAVSEEHRGSSASVNAEQTAGRRPSWQTEEDEDNARSAVGGRGLPSLTGLSNPRERRREACWVGRGEGERATGSLTRSLLPPPAITF